jgi:hypothetical protein
LASWLEMTIPGQENFDIFHNNYQTRDNPEELFDTSMKIDALSREIITDSSKNDEVTTVDALYSVDVDKDRIERRVLKKIDLR